MKLGNPVAFGDTLVCRVQFFGIEDDFLQGASFLELENMEVERYKMLHRSSIAHRDTVIQKLLEQLHLRDLVIEEQHAALRNAGVDKDIRDLD